MTNSSSQNQNFYLREMVLGMWYRQQALISLLEKKDTIGEKEFSQQLLENLNLLKTLMDAEEI